MTCPDCASERESRLRAERERDEARAEVARFTGGPKCAGVDWHFKTADALAAAQKRIGGLEAALRQLRDALDSDDRVIDLNPALDTIDAALSSPAVTTEGKKLAEEGET